MFLALNNTPAEAFQQLLQRATLNSSKNHVSLFTLMHYIAFEKYFTVNSPDSIAEYSKLQQQKFVILYALFVEKYREQ